MERKVFVSGCFDLIHAGHVEFFQQASRLGELYVGIGSDSTYEELKGKKPIYNQNERWFIVSEMKSVKMAFISSGSGMLDFERELRTLMPNIFVVNEDGDRPEKRALCKELGIEYRVLKRVPHLGLPERSSTEIKTKI